VGVISDTHGLLRRSAAEALAGSDSIVHAGDIGRPEVLEGLRAIAPLVAVRGNVDLDWAHALPDTVQRRFRLPVAVARIEFTSQSIEARIVELEA
jgi:predicted phosphodiesterase